MDGLLRLSCTDELAADPPSRPNCVPMLRRSSLSRALARNAKALPTIKPLARRGRHPQFQARLEDPLAGGVARHQRTSNLQLHIALTVSSAPTPPAPRTYVCLCCVRGVRACQSSSRPRRALVLGTPYGATRVRRCTGNCPLRALPFRPARVGHHRLKRPHDTRACLRGRWGKVNPRYKLHVFCEFIAYEEQPDSRKGVGRSAIVAVSTSGATGLTALTRVARELATICPNRLAQGVPAEGFNIPGRVCLLYGGSETTTAAGLYVCTLQLRSTRSENRAAR